MCVYRRVKFILIGTQRLVGSLFYWEVMFPERVKSEKFTGIVNEKTASLAASRFQTSLIKK